MDIRAIYLTVLDLVEWEPKLRLRISLTSGTFVIQTIQSRERSKTSKNHPSQRKTYNQTNSLIVHAQNFGGGRRYFQVFTLNTKKCMVFRFHKILLINHIFSKNINQN